MVSNTLFGHFWKLFQEVFLLDVGRRFMNDTHTRKYRQPRTPIQRVSVESSGIPTETEEAETEEAETPKERETHRCGNPKVRTQTLNRKGKQLTGNNYN